MFFDRMSFEYKNTPDKLASVLGSIILLLTAFINLKPNVRRVAYTPCYPDTLYGPVSYRRIWMALKITVLPYSYCIRYNTRIHIHAA